MKHLFRILKLLLLIPTAALFAVSMLISVPIAVITWPVVYIMTGNTSFFDMRSCAEIYATFVEDVHDKLDDFLEKKGWK